MGRLNRLEKEAKWILTVNETYGIYNHKYLAKH